MNTRQGIEIPTAKLDESAVRHIREQGRLFRAGQPFQTNAELALLYGVTEWTIRFARSGKSWRHVR